MSFRHLLGILHPFRLSVVREALESSMPQESTFSCLGTEDVHMDGARLKHTQLQVARASRRAVFTDYQHANVTNSTLLDWLARSCLQLVPLHNSEHPMS